MKTTTLVSKRCHVLLGDILSIIIKTRKSFISEYISLCVCSGIHTAVWTANSKPLTFLQINNWIHRCRISLIMSEKNKLRVLVHFTIHDDDVPCTVRWRYNAINFLQNPHNRQRGVFCEFTIWFLICCCYRIVVCNTVRRVMTWSNFPKIFTKDTHSSPVRATYGVSFGGSASDWYSASVPAMICAISCCIRPRYNGTRLYHDILHRVMTALDCIWSNINNRPVNDAHRCRFMEQLFHRYCPTTIPHIGSNDVFVITLNSRQRKFFNLIWNLM